MDVGTLSAVRTHPTRPQSADRFYAHYVADAVLAERLGYGFAWFGEHHFMADQWTPSPLLVCAAVAAQTTRLRVGTSVICMPFHHPLRLAEDLAVLDALSSGRVDFGFAVGSRDAEFHTFGIDRAEQTGRTWEAADLIWRCFTEPEPFSHEGRYWRFPDIDFSTRPLQDPFPFWVGAHGPKNISRAAERGWHLGAAHAAPYDARLTELGKDPAGHGVAAMRVVAVAETEDEAWTDAGEGVLYFMNADNVTVPGIDGPITVDHIRDGALRSTPFDPVVGTPKHVANHFEELASGARGRLTHMRLMFRHPGMATPVVERSMRLFAEHVLPAITTQTTPGESPTSRLTPA